MRQSVAPRRRPGAGPPPLSHDEQLILDLILSKGGDGILPRGIKFESQLAAATIRKALSSLKSKSLIEEVKSNKHMGKNVYIGFNCEPSKEVSGGFWYKNKELVGEVQDICLKHLNGRQVDTQEGIHRAVQRMAGDVSMEGMAELLTLMVLEDKIIEVKSTGLGAYHGIPVGKNCYRVARAAGGGGESSTMSGAFAWIPCGMCPRVAVCTPDGVVSPATCVYYNKWLENIKVKP